jgi:hypothetical protein
MPVSPKSLGGLLVANLLCIYLSVIKWVIEL